MLNNLLRILITKKAINTMRSESAKILAEQKLMQEQPITQITNQKEFEAYLRQVEREEKERVRYYSRPVMALSTAANLEAFFPFFLIMLIVIIGGLIYMLICILLGDGEMKYFVQSLIPLITGVALVAFCKYTQHYMENTMCLYYADRICIKKYRKEDVVITYDEVKECIKEKTIKIHNGRFEYPYKGGYIYTHMGIPYGMVL